MIYRKEGLGMSNEYKDWEKDKIEEEKLIVAEYPFLRARNIDGTVDINAKFPMMGLEIPDGWYKLFFQMCEDIKPVLKKYNLLNDFYFLQIKEKYNFLRCYYSKAPREVDEIIAKYEQMACYVCTICGKPATYETSDYIASFCDDCWKDKVRHQKGDWIEFKPYFTINTVTKGVHCDEKKISFKEEWDRYTQKIE